MNRMLSCLLLALMSFAVQAEEINVSARLVARPCTVDTDTVNKTVELGQGRASEMKTAGAGGEWTDFELLLTKCPAATVGATVTFSGTPDDDDATAFKNSADATGIALRLASRDRATTYQNESTMTQTIDTAAHTATFPLSARMFSPKGNPTSGQFAAAVNVSFTYQ
ncbi:fimbrial protein [Siccibacter colletis]|uniref:fimbrial protein n=1 Tax=Siccibacter colletis TaxID=1505757 RepID=UPI0028BED312|nr:fimbrial protein [Siccibacter colletis]WNN47057.1 fimbrial protein [Siccibacter colletis]